jgi:hypothetical protein
VFKGQASHRNQGSFGSIAGAITGITQSVEDTARGKEGREREPNLMVESSSIRGEVLEQGWE